MIREALAALLSFEDDIEVVAQVGRGDEVTAAAKEAKPDVALLDIEMPGLDGLTAAAALRQAARSMKIIILTTFGRPGYLRRAMESGVSGFIVKDSPADKLARTIRDVLAGQRVIDPDLAAAALAEGASPLTPRERDVLAAAPATAPRSPRSPPASSCPRARSATTCRPASRRPAPATAPRPAESPRNTAGSELHRKARQRPYRPTRNGHHKMNRVATPGYLRFPHVHGDLLTFVTEDDVWLAPADGRPRVAADLRRRAGQQSAVLARRRHDRLDQLAGRRHPRGLHRRAGRRDGRPGDPAHLLGRPADPHHRLDRRGRGARHHRRRPAVDARAPWRTPCRWTPRPAACRSARSTTSR